MSSVGRYRIVRELGRGGMAEVFEAIAVGEDQFERRVALKRLLESSLAIDVSQRMFLDEARVASQLHHANIVSILDYGIADEMPFQVLEFVDGLDLVSLLERAEQVGKTVPVEVALHICLEVAHALQYAHNATDASGRALEIVHRDVSPGNVLVSWSGDVKLSDFGIALAAHRTEVTRDGSAKGTLLFMAPEQLVRGQVDGRTDLFSLGCVLHALITGKSPLEGDEPLAELLAGRPLVLSAQVPDDVRAILSRSLAPARVARYRDAAQLCDALGTALARRLDRDATSVTREFLDGLREPRSQPVAAPGADLFDLEMVMSGDGVRRFTTRRQSAGTAEAVAASSPAPVRRRAPIAAALVIALAGVAGAVWFGIDRVGEEPAPSAVAQMPVGNASSALADAGPHEVTPGAPDAAFAGLAPGEPPDAGPKPRSVRPTRHRGRVPEATARGVLVIGGAGAHRAEIRVDGVSRGWAPKTLELPVGEHRVQLIDPSGRKRSRKITISERHTHSAPQRWVVDG